MERQLFTWDNWDEMDVASYYFYNVTLIVDIGNFKKGDRFDGAEVDFQRGKLLFFKDGEGVIPEGTFDLELKVKC